MFLRQFLGSSFPQALGSSFPQALMKGLRNSRKVGQLLSEVEITAVTIREKAVKRAVQARKEGFGPDRILCMVSTSESHHKTNSGIDTGLDVDKVLEAGWMTERIVGRRLRSKCAHTGRIPKSLTGRD